jgi:sec-independent protein translocase protein TatB
MFDIGWSELLLIGIVALIVVGPKDLPGMFRALGKFTAKARRMARDFQRAMEEAADDSGVREAAKDLQGLTNPRKMGLDKLKDAADKFDKWDPGKSAAARMSAAQRPAGAPKPETSGPGAAPEAAAPEAAAPEVAAAAPKAAAPKPAAPKAAAPKPAAPKAAAPKPAASKPAASEAAATKPAAKEGGA